MTTLLRIDDRDPSIVYSPDQWRGAGTVGDFDGTSMETLASGATSQLHFTGTSIAVFGSILGINNQIQGNPISTYSIDGKLVHQFAPSRENDLQVNVIFYQSDTLPQGNHTLLVTSLGDQGTFYLDYFEVTSDSSITGSPILTSLLSTATKTLSPTPAAVSQPTLSPNSASIPNGSSSKKVSIGPIVGGMLGGLVLLVIILTCLMIAVRWRRRRHQPYCSADFLRQMGQRTNLDSLEVNSHNQASQRRSQLPPGFHGAPEPFYLGTSQRKQAIISAI
ncbi:hypothetical protein BDQ12DRAFT_726135 [Crucibulum laeve]|uniref:Mid2 domain-containing protein n=1 Tax=Crucibulum laeve TaxID=68775 RepID=A0A5C3LQF0_9AGAR|nr:hypothetical protein BDQ12DRAFT_726135 [Crucibulum laeve]